MPPRDLVMKVLIVAVTHVRGLAEKPDDPTHERSCRTYIGNKAPGLIAVRYIAGNDVEDVENDDVDRHLNRHLVTNEDAKDDGVGQVLN